MKFIFYFLILIPGLVQAAYVNDFLIVPGDDNQLRAGPINAKTTWVELEKMFPKRFVKDSQMFVGENGAEVPVSNIIRRGEEATVVWFSAERTKIRKVLFLKKGTKWHTQENIKVGTGVKELETINGKVFKFTGLGWDYGGSIDALGGKLGKMEGLTLTLGSKKMTGPEAKKYLGDKVNPRSNAADIENFDIQVVKIDLSFE